MSPWPNVPSQGVPTLTEVVAWPDAGPAPSRSPEAEAVASPRAPMPAAPISEQQLVERVLADLQHQLDLVLDYRLREALAPVLARAADALVRDARRDLAATLRDVVARAVAHELARHRER